MFWCTFSAVFAFGVSGSCDGVDSASCQTDGGSLLQLKKVKPALTQLTKSDFTEEFQSTEEIQSSGESEVSWPGCECRRNHRCRKSWVHPIPWCYVDNRQRHRCPDAVRSRRFWWMQVYWSEAACKPEPKPNCYTREMWDDAKKDWCCKNKRIGCTPAPTPAPTPKPTAAPTPDPTAAPTPAPTPAPTTTTPPKPYNCNTREVWTAEKKEWCCANEQLGCPVPPICCKALTAECLACTAQQTVEEYCLENPTTYGCPTPEPTPAPTLDPTPAPTFAPTFPPTVAPTPEPTMAPTPPPPRPCTNPGAPHGKMNHFGPGKGGCQECACKDGEWVCSCVMRVRKEIHDLTDDEFDVFAWGVNELRKNDDWIHAVEVHLNSHRVSHNTHEFLYWHRRFLMEVENMIQKAIYSGHPTLSGNQSAACSVTFPYWNWALDKGDDTNVVFQPNRYGSINMCADNEPNCRAKCVTDGKFHWTTDTMLKYMGREYPYNCIMRAGDHNVAPDEWIDVKAAIEDHTFTDTKDFPGLSQLIERSYHNGIHGAIGGNGGHMRTMVSPYDPVFYLHHAFVDYMWKHWQTVHLTDKDHKEGKLTATGLLGSSGEQDNSDFEQSLHMLDDNPDTLGHQDFTCVEYSERYSEICPGKYWLNDCMQVIAVNATLREKVRRVVVNANDPETGKLSDICSPAHPSQKRHAKIWLDGLKGMGMLTEDKIQEILKAEAHDEQSLKGLMPLELDILSVPEDHQSCSRTVCANTDDVQTLCAAHFPYLMAESE